MSILAIASVGTTGLGPVFAGYVEMNPHLEWRWIQWIHLMYEPWTFPRESKAYFNLQNDELLDSHNHALVIVSSLVQHVLASLTLTLLRVVHVSLTTYIF